MGKGDSVLRHPDKEWIMERLLAGESTRDVEGKLKQKHPKNPRMWLSYMTLQAFRQEHLKIKGEVLNEIKEERQKIIRQSKKDKQLEEIRNSEVYSNAKTKIATELLDYNEVILNIAEKCQSGIESLESINENKPHHLNHQQIIGYLTRLESLMMSHHKVIMDEEKKNKGATEESYDKLQSQLQILKEVVREVLGEMAPDVLPIFVERLKERWVEKESGASDLNKQKEIVIEVKTENE